MVTIRVNLETLPGQLLLLEHFYQAEGIIDRDPSKATSIAQWCNQTDVQLLAAKIQLYHDSWPEIIKTTSERDLKMLEVFLNSATEAFSQRDEETCQNKISQISSRLDQIGIQIPEPTLLSLLSILTLLLLPTLIPPEMRKNYLQIGIGKAAMVASLVALLSLPGMVYCEEIYILEDFDDLVDIADLTANWFYTKSGKGEVSVNDGSFFLNLSREYTPGSKGWSLLRTPDNKLVEFMGIETRLKCSSDNKLESDIGGGIRVWGFAQQISSADTIGVGWFQIGFLSSSADNDWAPTGLGVLSMYADQVLFYQPLSDVDIREWHTYTVLWRPGNGTFLVDGEVVAITPNVPYEQLSAMFYIEIDMVQDGRWVPQDVTLPCENKELGEGCTEEFIQVDQIHIFEQIGIEEDKEADISELSSRAQELIGGLTLEGENTTKVASLCDEAAQNWASDYFDARITLSDLVAKMEDALPRCRMVDERNFSARSTIDASSAVYPDHVEFLENWYSQAQNHWTTFDANRTLSYLGWILDTTFWQETAVKFAQAQGTIDELEKQGQDRVAAVSKGDFTRAENAWLKHDSDTTHRLLDLIIARVPEPVVVSLITLFLPPILKRRK
jgi:hypothetical protein